MDNGSVCDWITFSWYMSIHKSYIIVFSHVHSLFQIKGIYKQERQMSQNTPVLFETKYSDNWLYVRQI